MSRHTLWLAGNLLLAPVLALSQTPAAPAPVQPPPLYTQAMQFLAQGDTAKAEQLLHVVVNQHPEWAGAWMDLALMAIRQERYAEADEFLQVIQEKFSPLPPEIAQAVAGMQSMVQHNLKSRAQADTPKSERQTVFMGGVGYETNANAGLHMGSIMLTLPDGTATLNVDESSRARGAAFARAGLIHQAVTHWQGAELTWQMHAQARRYDGMSQYDNIELLPQLSLQHPAFWGHVTAGWQAIRLNNQAAYQTPIVRWQMDHALTNSCTWRQHLQAEERQFMLAPHLDSHWRAYRSTWVCPVGKSHRQLYAQLAQENAATAARPGGDTRHLSLGVQQDWLQPLGYPGHNLQLKVDWLHAQDTAAYSALLDNGNNRRLNRLDWRLSWTAPVANSPGWRWSVSALSNRQNSNIVLFSQRNFSLETTIWHAW